MSEQLRRAVEEHGFVVVPDERGDVASCSTVGLTASGLPELVVLGLPADPACALLNEVAARLLDGEEPADGAPLEGLLEGADPVLLVVCTDDGELQFLDGRSDFDPDRAAVECLHEVVERDLTLVEAVRGLPEGHAAERDAVGDPWSVSPW